MKTKTSRLILLSLLPAAALVSTSCSSDSSGKGGTGGTASREVSAQQGVPGGEVVDTYRVTAKVTDVDHATRHYTLQTPDGKKTQYKAGPEVTNFDQVRVGDLVKATVTQQLVVRVREEGDPPSDPQTSIVEIAPKGGKPGVLMADTVEVTARVKSVDLKHHKATLQFPDGDTKTVTVRPDVKLSSADVGREVVLRATEAVAIRVEKP
jgi:hypothetical protein